MHRSYRRVVTGHDKNGAAIIESDQVATQTLERPNRPGVRLTNFWITDQTPAEYDGPTETCLGPLTLKPPARGSVFRCVEFMPEDPNRYYHELAHKFHNPVRVSIYSLSFIFLGLHLYHGFSSSFQSVGINNKFSIFIKKLTTAFSVVIPVGLCEL